MTPAEELTFLRTLQRNIRYFEVMGRAPLGTEWLRLKVVARMAALALVVAAGGAKAQGHMHGHEVMPDAVGRFYESWRRPDSPTISCCNLMDCYPTEAKFESGRWSAKRREDGAWLTVPASKIEQNRDSPDGRNHLCAPPPSRASAYENGVICFIAGAGG